MGSIGKVEKLNWPTNNVLAQSLDRATTVATTDWETKPMKFQVTLDRDEDGVWVVECPSIPGCVSQGSTKDEALANIGDAIKLCLEVRSERGLPLTVETRQVEVVA